MKNFICNHCNYTTSRTANYDRHLTTKKHLEKVNAYNNSLIEQTEFTCEHCDYTTSRSANYDRHLTTAKHLNKVNDVTNSEFSHFSDSTSHDEALKNNKNKEQQLNKNVYKCNSCGNCFNRMNNLTRHQNICVTRALHEQRLNEKIQFLEKENNYFKTEMNNYKNLLSEAGKLVKSSVTALTYVVDNYETAPAIKQIKFDDINTTKMNKIQFIEEILSAYKNKILNKYLGDSIITIYKKRNPLDQAVWNTDATRMTYLLKELLENKTSSWIVDKKGAKTIEYMIDPILKHVRKLLLKYNTYASKKKMKPSSVEFEIALENSKAIVKLANDIDKGITAQGVLKYISPKMRLKNKCT